MELKPGRRSIQKLPLARDLFDDLVGAREKRVWNFEAERFGCDACQRDER
jgi:hypothetical protein